MYERLGMANLRTGTVYFLIRKARYRIRTQKRADCTSWGMDIIQPLRHFHSSPGLCETFQTIGVREREICRVHAIPLLICLPRDPALTSRGRAGLVSKEPTDTTDREYFRCDARPLHRIGRLLIGNQTRLPNYCCTVQHVGLPAWPQVRRFPSSACNSNLLSCGRLW